MSSTDERLKRIQEALMLASGYVSRYGRPQDRDRIIGAIADCTALRRELAEEQEAMGGEPDSGTCLYCTDDDPVCAAAKNNFLCTRPDGHDGAHAACGSGPEDHPMQTWV